jgi:hypothetical protein
MAQALFSSQAIFFPLDDGAGHEALGVVRYLVELLKI